MNVKENPTYQVKIYMSGPIEVAKQTIRKYVRCGLCVTIEPIVFIYTGGEENGFVVGLLDYPRFPSPHEIIDSHAEALSILLLDDTCQNSALIVTPEKTRWFTKREL